MAPGDGEARDETVAGKQTVGGRRLKGFFRLFWPEGENFREGSPATAMRNELAALGSGGGVTRLAASRCRRGAMATTITDRSDSRGGGRGRGGRRSRSNIGRSSLQLH